MSDTLLLIEGGQLVMLYFITTYLKILTDGEGDE